jgi:3',5'-cyclic AMP phosphodiesterase CpdA
MLRLAHLSDIHLTAADLEWTLADWFNKRYAAWFNFRWLGRRHRFRHADGILRILMAELRQQPPDHVIFSGDATALGFESEFRRAAECLGVANTETAEVSKDFGKLSGLAVPGNHDYCTRPAAASGLFERYFGPWQTGVRIDGHVYPFAQRVGPVWLVGVNSCTGNRWAWDAGGSVGPEQTERLARLLATLDPGPRILVTHYPVALASGAGERRTHGLRDVKQLIDVASRGGVCLWLHGHRHKPYCLRPGLLTPFPIICAGSATQTGCWSYSQYVLEEQRLQVRRRTFCLQTKSFQESESYELTLRAEEPAQN